MIQIFFKNRKNKVFFWFLPRLYEQWKCYVSLSLWKFQFHCNIQGVSESFPVLNSDPVYTMPIEFENSIRSAVLASCIRDASRISKFTTNYPKPLLFPWSHSIYRKMWCNCTFTFSKIWKIWFHVTNFKPRNSFLAHLVYLRKLPCIQMFFKQESSWMEVFRQWISTTYGKHIWNSFYKVKILNRKDSNICCIW